MDTDQTEVVQPEAEGQGDGGQGAAPYQEWLDRIPEEVRGEVEPVFKDWDANVTRRFQENAERQSTWEPYEQLGVQNVPADEVQWLMQFRDALSSPEVVKDWYESYAQQHGLTPAEAQQQQQQQPQQGVDDFFAAEPDVSKLLDERLGPLQQQVEQFNQWREQQEYDSRVAEAERFVEGQISKLEAEHPDEFNRDAVEKFVANYIESDPQNAVQRAFDDWRAIRGQIEKATLQGKASQPAPAESGGVAAAAPEEVRTLEAAREVARQMLHQANQS